MKAALFEMESCIVKEDQIFRDDRVLEMFTKFENVQDLGCFVKKSCGACAVVLFA